MTGRKVTLASRLSGIGSGVFNDVAIEAGGATAIIVDQHTRQLIRVNLTTPVTLAPSLQSLESLFIPFGVAVEAGGTMALVTDFGVSGGGGRLVRVNLATGLVTPITPVGAGLPIPRWCDD